MIIWSGYGLLVPAVFLLSFFLTPQVVDGLSGNPRYWQTHLWPRLVCFLLAGGICGALGVLMNYNERRHTLYFIPVEYWGIIIAVVGVALVIFL
jgi:hypothetical protein